MSFLFLVACILAMLGFIAMLMSASLPRESKQRRPIGLGGLIGLFVFGGLAITLAVTQSGVRNSLSFGSMVVGFVVVFVATLIVTIIIASPSLRRYIITRLFLTIPMVLILVTLVFFVLRILPGDPISSKLGGRITEEQAANLRSQLGLDKPIGEQYLLYLGGIAHMDFGFSMTEGQRPILDELGERLPATLELTLPAFFLTLLLGILPGALAAKRHRKFIDYFLRLLSIVTYSIPVFWLGLMLQLLFSIRLGWTPIDHRIDPILQTTFQPHTQLYLLDTLLDGNIPAFLSVVHHLILPVAALGIILSGVFVRITRANMLETLQQDFVTAARARGVPESTVVYRHSLRNAFIPVLTLIGLQFAILLAGAVLTETTFSWPGMGQYLVERISARDYTAVQGAVTLFAMFVAFTSLAVDVIYGFVDPRIRY